jgi:late competence protein required for DNA uptake (superfamily II DNA/RNA helicase)
MAKLTKAQLKDYGHVSTETVEALSDGRTLCRSCGTTTASKKYMHQVGKSGHYYCLHCVARNGFDNVRRYVFVEALAKMGCTEQTMAPGIRGGKCWSCVAKSLL